MTELPPPAIPLCTLLNKSAEEQTRLLSWLETETTGQWFVLTRACDTTPDIAKALRAKASVGGVMRKGLPCLRLKGSWRTGDLRTSATLKDWTIWIGPCVSEETRIRIASGLAQSNLEWSRALVPKPGCLTWREHRHGPGAPYYDRPGRVTATDGSVLADGRMGTAAVEIDGSVQRREVDGLPSSLRAELCGLLLVATVTDPGVELTILTDSLNSIQALAPQTRRDFRPSPRLLRHPHRNIIREVVACLRRRTAPTLIVKIMAHRGEPLNEAADSAANAAVPADPLPLIFDPLACYFTYAGMGPRIWGANLKTYLNKTAAEQWQQKLVLRKIPPDQALELGETRLNRILNVTETWLLRPRRGREFLGAALAALPNNALKRRVLQTLGNAYPTQLNLHRWKLSPTTTCTLCNGTRESMAHLQCWCPKLAEARIKAHHHVWREVWASVTQCSCRNSSSEWTFAIETTVESLTGLRPAPGRHAVMQHEWEAALQGLTDEETQGEETDQDKAWKGLGKLIEELLKAEDQTPEHRMALIAGSEVTKLHEMAGILMKADEGSSLDDVISQIEAERQELRPVDEVSRKRPDGVAVNWPKRRFFMLEYTRCFDSNNDAMERVDKYKENKYEPLRKAVERKLGSGWTCATLTFSTGVKGSIDEEKWNRQLTQLGLNAVQSGRVIRKAVRATVQAMDILFTARSAARAPTT